MRPASGSNSSGPTILIATLLAVLVLDHHPGPEPHFALAAALDLQGDDLHVLQPFAEESRRRLDRFPASLTLTVLVLGVLRAVAVGRSHLDFMRDAGALGLPQPLQLLAHLLVPFGRDVDGAVGHGAGSMARCKAGGSGARAWVFAPGTSSGDPVRLRLHCAAWFFIDCARRRDVPRLCSLTVGCPSDDDVQDDRRQHDDRRHGSTGSTSDSTDDRFDQLDQLGRDLHVGRARPTPRPSDDHDDSASGSTGRLPGGDGRLSRATRA